jgi:predicted DNA-binding transcriptional regulator AlpA
VGVSGFFIAGPAIPNRKDGPVSKTSPSQLAVALAKARTSIASRNLIDANDPAWLGARLLAKRDVLAIANVTFPTIWAWMRAGKFPRARAVGGKSMWLSPEIEAWLASLPIRQLKGDDITHTSP